MPHSQSLPESTASEFLNVLNSLHCPYTQDVDESYISELLFSPGEHRIRLMLWIFGEIEESIESMASSEAMIRQESDLGLDNRIQFLTSLGFSFGICRNTDFDLIRGNAPFLSQLSLWKKLLGLVQYSKKPYLNSALSEDTHIMESILRSDGAFVQQISQDQVDILPPNLLKEMKMVLPNEKRKLGGFTNLEEEVKKLSKELEEQRGRLTELEHSLMYTTEDDKVTLSNVSCKLDLTLNDIDQMMTAYEQVFTNNFLPYCNKQTEEFGNLGPLIQIVSKQLRYVATTFDHLVQARESNDVILKCGDSLLQTGEKLSKYASVFDSFLSQSVPCLEKLEKTMNTAQRLNNISPGQHSEQSIFACKLSESISEISDVL